MSLQALELIIPLFALIAAGYTFRKTGFVGDSFAGELNRVVFYVALPAMLFLETADLPDLTADIALTAVIIPVAVILTALIALSVSSRLGAKQRGPFVQATYRSNLAYLGLPIVSTLLGGQVLGIIAVAIAAGVIINSVTSIVVLRFFQESSEGDSVFQRFADVFRNPLIISIILGLSASVVSLPIPGIIAEVLDLFGRMSLPLILIVVGFRLSFQNLKGFFGTALSSAFFKLIIMPALVWAMTKWLLPAGPLLSTTLVLLCTMPTAVVSQTFAGAFDADESLAAATVSMTTLLSGITIPLWALVLL